MDRSWKSDRGRHFDNNRGGIGRDNGRHRGDRIDRGGGDYIGGHSSAARANLENHHEVKSNEDSHSQQQYGAREAGR